MHTGHIVQSIRGPKLSWLGHQVSIHRKTFTFAAKQHPQVPKHLEIHGKTFAVQAKTMKTVKVLALEHFVLAILAIYTVASNIHNIAILTSFVADTHTCTCSVDWPISSNIL